MIPFREAYAEVIAEHREWLAGYDRRYLKQWNDRLNADEESATCEACFRRVFEADGCHVAPNEDLDGKRKAPDFRLVKGQAMVYAEVTCLNSHVVTRKTGLEDFPSADRGYSEYGSLNRAIFDACCKKEDQLEAVTQPTILAVGTFHYLASAVCIDRDMLSMLLTGTLGVAFDFDAQRGCAVGDGREITHLHRATFVRPGCAEPVQLARISVSALVLGGFAFVKPRLFGLLHPQPVRSFDPHLLQHIPFARLKEGYREGVLAVEWLDSDAAP